VKKETAALHIINKSIPQLKKYLSKWFYDIFTGVVIGAVRCDSFVRKEILSLDYWLWMNTKIYVVRTVGV
jgi:hypothetical protein